ncbi:Transposase [Vibrio spartinae]|uniref:Transposase n=1 Tax=Vibrio spartinae TaxID=1918945 RepID=A0ABX6R3P5_9VIBR|nr:Transposase [Vibrio spartinae]
MTKRRKYSAEFKREAVALTQQPGVSCRQIALDIGINPTKKIIHGRMIKLFRAGRP